MEALFSTLTFAALIVLCALPFLWRDRGDRAMLPALTLGVAGYWVATFGSSLVHSLVRSIFLTPPVIDLLPVGFIGLVVGLIVTTGFELLRYLPLFVLAHYLRREPRLVPPSAAAMAIGFWGMMLLRVLWNDSSAAALSCGAGAPLYLSTVFGVVSFVILGLALSRSLRAGMLTTAALVTVQLMRQNGPSFLPDSSLFEQVLLIVDALVVLGLFAIAILIWRGRDSGKTAPDKNGPAASAGP